MKLRSSFRLSAALGMIASAAALYAGCSSVDDSPTDAGSDASQEAGDATADAATANDGGGPCADSGLDLPQDLRCTGFYSDWAARTISADARPYTPGIEFWSDGALKQRFIYLPPSTKIDTTDMDQWVFPVGTKVWKEFRLGGKQIETRLFWKISASQWTATTYEWSADQSKATRNDTGHLNAVGTYEIPNSDQCVQCHGGSADRLLGFEAISLALPTAAGLTLSVLKSEGRLTAPPTITNVKLPEDATDAGKAGPALGFLHTNCGLSCHNGSDTASASFTHLHMRLSAKAYFDAGLPVLPTDTDTYRTAVLDGGINKPGPYASYIDAGFLRITKGNAAHSLIPTVDGVRGPGTGQMPPLVTHIVDDAGVKAVTDWINAMP